MPLGYLVAITLLHLVHPGRARASAPAGAARPSQLLLRRPLQRAPVRGVPPPRRHHRVERGPERARLGGCLGSGVGLTVVVVLGLALIALRELQTGPAVDRALGDGLGAAWRTDIDEKIAARLRRRLPLHAHSVRAGPLPTERCRADRRHPLRRRREVGTCSTSTALVRDPPSAPVLIHLHGGAFGTGRKNREARPLLYRLASQGWVCISANYRLGRATRFPEHVIDARGDRLGARARLRSTEPTRR